MIIIIVCYSQDQVDNCTCWEELSNKTAAVKNCKVAKNIEDKFEKDFKNCKKAFINCSKLEDEALDYMIKCYTSEDTITSNLKELLQVKDSCTKLKTNQEALVTSSRAGWKVNRQKNSDSVTCATYITQVTTLNAVSFILICPHPHTFFRYFQLLQSSSLTGKGSTIVSQSTTLIKETVQTCSSSEVIQLQANIVTLVAVIVKVTSLVTHYQKVSILSQ